MHQTTRQRRDLANISDPNEAGGDRNIGRSQTFAAEDQLNEILQERVVSSRNRRNPRGVKRKMSNFPLRPRKATPMPKINLREAVWVVK